MPTILFYEKPGCKNNTKQKQWLEAAGHQLEVRDILTHPWKPAELRGYLPGTDPAPWFNRTAPAIKRGEIDPAAFTAPEAVAAMVAMPLLIKRPLLQIDGIRFQGFNPEILKHHLSLIPLPGHEDEVATLESADLNTCPQVATNNLCPAPKR